MSKRDIILPLVALLAAFTVLVFLHTVFTPIFEAPDEIWHYAHVRWIAEGHGLPSLTDDRSGALQEAAQPPLYYALAALLSREVDDTDLPSLLWHNPGFGYQAPGTSSDNKNMLIHTERELWPWHGAVLAIHITRLASWAFGLVAILSTWALGYEVFRRRSLALMTASWVAFQPQFIFLSSVVNNDSAAAALAALSLWLMMRMVRRGASWRLTVAMGLAVGLAALTKTSLLLLVPLAAICLLLGWFRCTSRTPSRCDLRRAIGAMMLYFFFTLLVGGWWYLRNLLLYGDPLGLHSHVQTPWGRATLVSLVDLLPEVPLVLRSFWAAYGWGHVTWPSGIYLLLWLWTLLLIIAACYRLMRGWVGIIAEAKHRRSLGVLLEDMPTLGGTLSLLWLGGISAALVRWMQQVEAPHGRLLFPAIGAWGLLLSLGVVEIRRASHWLGWVMARGLFVLCVVLATLAPGARILATFAPPRLIQPEWATAHCAHPVDVRYGDVAQLLCADVSPQRVVPGAYVQLKTCWMAQAPIDRDYSVFAHLLGPGMVRVGERHTYPGLGRYPTSLWRVHQAFCDTFAIEVASWAEVPLQYRVEVGLFDASTGDRLAARSPSGQSLEPPVVNTVVVVSQSSERYTPQTPLTATLGSAIKLVGADVPAEAERGDTVEVVLYWTSVQNPGRDYVAFVHLWRPGDTAPLAQHDAQPRNGWYPTSAWATGEQVQDRHRFRLPETLQPGAYPLWTGLYDAENGERLPAYGPDGRYPDDLVPLGMITVQ